MSARELAVHLGVDVRTARRMLGELAALGYARQGGGRYRRYRVTDAARALWARLAGGTDVDS